MTTAEILKQLPPQIVKMYLVMRQQILLRKKGERISTESFTKDIILSEEGINRLMKIIKEPCEYCENGIEVETAIIDGVYYTMVKDTKYCPYCGRKLEDV